MSAGGGCESAVSARSRCGWFNLRECDNFLYGRTDHLMLREAVYKCYVRPAILYGYSVWKYSMEMMNGV